MFRLGWVFVIGNAFRSGFHLQPTPQVYETLQDSIVLPDAYRFSADVEGAASDAVRLLGTLLPDHQEKADFRITVGVKEIKLYVSMPA